MKLSKYMPYGCSLAAVLLLAAPAALGQAVCGDDAVNQPSEVCDGIDDAACPGQCIPPGLPNECTCMPDCDDGDPFTADGFHEVTDTSIWGWIPGLMLFPGESTHFHVEAIEWTRLEKWFEFIAGDIDINVEIHVTATIDDVETDHLWEQFNLPAGESVEFHGLIENVNITGVWVWIKNIGDTKVTFDFHLHWEFLGTPSGLPDGCLSIPANVTLARYAGCLTCDEADLGCSSPVTSTAPIEEEDNFVPKMELALVQAGAKINDFQRAVQDILAKLNPPPQVVKIANVQDAIAAIQAKPGSNVVIFGHGAQASFKIGEDDLADPAIQSKFLAAVNGQMATLTLFGCSVSQGDPGQAFLKKLTAGLGIEVKTWGGKVYAFGNDVVIPSNMQNRFFVTSVDDKKEIPTVSEWGLVVMALMVLAAGTIMMTRRRTAVA